MTERAALPLKLYYRIGEVANVVGVETHVLRYWESEFPTIRPQKSSKGHRVYSRKDVEKLLRVKELLYSEGYTVQGAKRRLGELTRGQAKAESPSADGGAPARVEATTPFVRPAGEAPLAHSDKTARTAPERPEPLRTTASHSNTQARADAQPSEAELRMHQALVNLRARIQAELDALGA